MSASSEPTPHRFFFGLLLVVFLKIEGMKNHYDAIEREVNDGDTCTDDIDLGLSTSVHEFLFCFFFFFVFVLFFFFFLFLFLCF